VNFFIHIFHQKNPFNPINPLIRRKKIDAALGAFPQFSRLGAYRIHITRLIFFDNSHKLLFDTK
jgi:hypothetical protein